MKFTFLSVIFLCLWVAFIPSSVWAEGEIMEVTVRGHSAIYSEDLVNAKRNALQDAMRSALEQAVGTFVSAESFGENFVLISDRVTTKTQGYVKKYDILYKAQEVNIYTVLIKAQVSLKLVKDDLIALKILQEAMRKPRIMVVIPEQHLRRPIPDPAGETEIIRIFVEKDFKVVDQAQVKKIRQNDQVKAALRGDQKAAAAIGRQYGAEVIIIGEAFSQLIGRELGMIACQARVEARAVECDTGDILAVHAKAASAPALTEAVAGKAALQKAGGQLAEYLMTQIVKKWNDKVTNSREVRLVISDISFSQLIALENKLKTQFGGVEATHRRSFEQGVAMVDVQYRGDAQQLAEELVRKGGDGLKIEVTGFTMNRIDLKLMEKR